MQAVTFDDEDLAFDALLVAATADGSWAELRGALARGLAAELDGVQPDPAAARAAESVFRRARGLLAGEDLLAWLAERDVTVGDWRAHVRRMLLAEDQSAPSPDAVPDLDLAIAARTAVRLEDLVARAARPLLLGAAAGEQPLQDDEQRATSIAASAAADLALPLADRNPEHLAVQAAAVLRLRGQLERARTELDARTVRETIAEHSLDWTVLVYDELVVQTEQAAREAMLCVGEDGMDLEAVGGLVGAQVHRHRHVAAEAAVAGPHLLAATPGAALGPVSGADGWRMLVLRERRAPTADDPATWARARELALEQILDRRLAGRVRWHVIH